MHSVDPGGSSGSKTIFLSGVFSKCLGDNICFFFHSIFSKGGVCRDLYDLRTIRTLLT